MGRTGARFGRSERVQEITRERIDSRICTRCGKNRPDEGRKMCRVCLDIRIEQRNKTTNIKSANISVSGKELGGMSEMTTKLEVEDGFLE